MNGSSSDGPLSSRRAVLAKAAAGLAAGGGALAVVAVAREPQAVAATTGIPWLVTPSNDGTGMQDVANVKLAISTYGVAWLGPGTYYAASPVVCNEGQYVCGSGRNATTWNLKATGIPAFQWTTANTSSYRVNGMGGITGLTIANTVNPGGNPSDGSIGVQMGDIVSLECDVYVQSCEYGLLLENQYFWTERGDFRLSTYYCTNPVTLQVAASGASTRTGSFDRTRVRWFANDNLISGKNGLSLLAGAQIAGRWPGMERKLRRLKRQHVFALYKRDDSIERFRLYSIEPCRNRAGLLSGDGQRKPYAHDLPRFGQLCSELFRILVVLGFRGRVNQRHLGVRWPSRR
jgi:hypothetical protein